MSDPGIPGAPTGPGATSGAAAGGAPGGGERQPTEEELRQYLGQMRGAHVGQIVAEVVSALLNGAQVKLGRRDGRLLLDLAGLVAEKAGPHLDDEFTSQVDDVLNQLRLAQVEAEKEVAEAREQGHEEPNDLGSPAGTSAPGSTERPAREGRPAGEAPPAGQERPTQQNSAASRLWVPGQG